MKSKKKIRKSKKQNRARNTILIIVLIFVVFVIGLVLLGTCENNDETITSNEAFEIVLEDLGLTSQEADHPHIHEGTYEGQPCYNIYVTANGKSLTYVVSIKGEILHKGEGGHSH